MKSLSLIVGILLSTQVSARQYFQCNSLDQDTTDVMVVNLETIQGGTVFLSSGMQNPEDERRLVNMSFSKIENGKHVYAFLGDLKGSVVIPSLVIGQVSNWINIDLYLGTSPTTYSCFARIYND